MVLSKIVKQAKGFLRTLRGFRIYPAFTPPFTVEANLNETGGMRETSCGDTNHWQMVKFFCSSLSSWLYLRKNKNLY